MVSQKLPVPKHYELGISYLPGGNIPNADFDTFLQNLKADFPKFPESMLTRMALATVQMFLQFSAQQLSQTIWASNLDVVYIRQRLIIWFITNGLAQLMMF